MDIFTGKLAGAALTLAALTGCAHHGHHMKGHAHGEGGISVSGSGEARGVPDIARLTAGVEVRAATPEEAVSLASAQMDRLLVELKGAGIAPADLRTQNYSVSYERDYQPVPPPIAAPTRAGTRGVQVAAAPVTPPGRYLVTNSVEITVRKVSELGRILSTATTAGANNVWGISFDIEDREPLVKHAREHAFLQARERAENIAAISGLKLGPIVAIDDGSQGGGVVTPMFARAAMNMDSAVPVERGELTVTHQLNIQYAIAGTAGPGQGHPHPHPHDGHGAPPPPAPVPPAPVAPAPPAVAPAAPAVPAAPAPAAPVAPTLAPAPAAAVPPAAVPATGITAAKPAVAAPSVGIAAPSAPAAPAAPVAKPAAPAPSAAVSAPAAPAAAVAKPASVGVATPSAQ